MLSLSVTPINHLASRDNTRFNGITTRSKTKKVRFNDSKSDTFKKTDSSTKKLRQSLKNQNSITTAALKYMPSVLKSAMKQAKPAAITDALSNSLESLTL